MEFELEPPIPQSEPLTIVHVNIRKYYWKGWKRKKKEDKER